MKYRTEIDGLRAVAVMAVLLFHLEFEFFSGGFVGVDVFFVISGYLITNIIVSKLRENTFSLIEFYERRVRRIFPALYLVLISSFIFAYFFFMPVEFSHFSKSLFSAAAFFSNLFFWSQSGYFDIDSQLKPLLHTWSLSIEEQFYLLFPLVLIFAYRFAKKHILAILLLLFGASLLANVHYTQLEKTSSFYFAHLRAWELLLGSLLAVGAFPPISKKWLYEVGSALGLSMILFAVIYYDKNTVFPGVFALIPTFGTVFFLYFTSHKTHVTISEKTMNLEAFRFIGKISYSLYLWHWPIIVFYKYYTAHDLNILDKVIIGFLSILLSSLSWYFFEKPIKIKERVLRTPKYAAITILSSSLLLLIGIYGSIIDPGIISRFPDKVVAYAQASDDFNPRRDECHILYSVEHTAFKPCKMGPEDGQARFLSWGDSYADAIMPVFQRLSEKYKISGEHLSISECAPTLGTYSTKKWYQKCQLFNRWMVEYVKRNNITHVILTSVWAQRSIYYDTPKGETLSNNTALEYGFIKMLKALNELNVQVFVVGKIPINKKHEPSLIARYKNTNKNIEGLLISKIQYEEQVRYFKTIKQNAHKQVSFQEVNLHEKLCPQKKCRLFDDKGALLYRNYNHLSTEGALFLEDVFTPIFKKLHAAQNQGEQLSRQIH